MLRGFVNGLKDLLYPKICLGCRKKLLTHSIDGIVCQECWKKIKRNLPPFCYRCGRQLKAPLYAKHVCGGCLKKKLHYDRAFSPCLYEGTLKELIHGFKYRGRDYFGSTISRLMIDFIREYDLPVEYLDLVMPVPLAKARAREREFNQAEILSERIAGEFKKAHAADTLVRHRPTRTQTDLKADERFANLKDSFSVKDETLVKGKNILLIDDVLTTGATASWAARALKDAGAQIVFVLTAAN